MTPKRCPVSGFLNHKTTESKWVYIYIEYQPEPEHQPLFHWHMMDVFFFVVLKAGNLAALECGRESRDSGNCRIQEVWISARRDAYDL